VTVPLAAGDPVVAPDLGVRGTIGEIVAGEATVLGGAVSASASHSTGFAPTATWPHQIGRPSPR